MLCLLLSSGAAHTWKLSTVHASPRACSPIVRHYLTTWFPLDATTIFVPLIFDLYQASDAVVISEESAADSAAVDAGGVSSHMSVLRVLRVLRLMKLVRLVRASRMWERWKTRITLSYGSITMLQCAVMVMVSAHWYACVMGLQASLHTNPLDTWLGPELYGFCYRADPADAIIVNPSAPIPVAGCEELTTGSWYLAALAWSFMVLTGTGGTDRYPSSHSDGETFIVMILVVVGALLWTRVLAMFCDVATNSNPGLTHFHQQLDGLNDFITTNNLPKEMG